MQCKLVFENATEKTSQIHDTMPTNVNKLKNVFTDSTVAIVFYQAKSFISTSRTLGNVK